MSRHPRYLELARPLEWGPRTRTSGHHLWWLIAVLSILAVLLIGVRVTGGMLLH